MKRIYYILSLIALTLMACNEHDVTITVISGTSVTPSSYTADVHIVVGNQDGGKSHGTVEEYGVFLSSSPDVSTNNTRCSRTIPKDSVAYYNDERKETGYRYVYTLTNLSPNKTYYVLPYVANGLGMITGEVVSFTTKGSVSVTTKTATNVTFTKVQLNGNVATEGSVSVDKKGFVVSVSGFPTISNNKFSWQTAGSTGSYSRTFSNLDPNTTYYYRAYVVVNGKEIYGERVSFKTPNPVGIITLNLNDAMYITSSSAVATANITIPENEKGELEECGIFYSDSSTPTQDNYKLKVYYDSNIVTNWTGTKLMYCEFDNLTANSTYYFRAYFKIGDTYYLGNQIKSFTTLCEGGSSGVLGADINDFIGKYTACAYLPNTGESLSWDTVEIYAFHNSYDNTTKLAVTGLYNGYSFFAAIGGHNSSTNSVELYNGLHLSDKTYYYVSDPNTSYYSTFLAVYYDSINGWKQINNMTGGEAVLRFNDSGKLIYEAREIPDSDGRYTNGYIFAEYLLSTDEYTGWFGVFTQLELTKVSSSASAPAYISAQLSTANPSWPAPHKLPVNGAPLLRAARK